MFIQMPHMYDFIANYNLCIKTEYYGQENWICLKFIFSINFDKFALIKEPIWVGGCSTSSKLLVVMFN